MKFSEAFNFGDDGKLFNKQKQDWYKEPRKIEKIFPGNAAGQPRHMETITANSFKKAVEKLRHHTGLGPNDANQLLFKVMGYIQAVAIAQRPHTAALEKLAVQVVLELPEFKMFKDTINSGELKLDVKLSTPSLAKPSKPPEKDPEMRPIEVSDPDGNLRRQFARMMTQGNATNKLYLYQLANEQLNKIDPNLCKNYGALSAIVHAAYYSTPAMTGDPDEDADDEFRDMAENAAVGSVQILPNEDGTYTLKARSPFFPYLVHEFVKGLYEYLSMDVATDEELSGENLAGEQIEIMSGPQLYANFQKMVPREKMEYLPMIYKLLLKQPINNIKEVVAGGGKGQAIINQLSKEAEQIMDAHNNEDFQEPEAEEPDLDGPEPEDLGN